MYLPLENNISEGPHVAIIFDGVAGLLRTQTKTSGCGCDPRDTFSTLLKMLTLPDKLFSFLFFFPPLLISSSHHRHLCCSSSPSPADGFVGRARREPIHFRPHASCRSMPTRPGRPSAEPGITALVFPPVRPTACRVLPCTLMHTPVLVYIYAASCTVAYYMD